VGTTSRFLSAIAMAWEAGIIGRNSLTKLSRFRGFMPLPFSSQFIAGIEANRTIKDGLVAALRQQRGRRRISVTDLVNSRQAY